MAVGGNTLKIQSDHSERRLSRGIIVCCLPYYNESLKLGEQPLSQGHSGLMQLVSYGAQDIYISGNPQITFWKILYKRHTNFAVESIEVTFNGQADFNKRVTAVINRNADLMYKAASALTASMVTGCRSGRSSPRMPEL